MRRGFTLIELLIVVAIIGVMLASAVVNISSGKDAARVKEASRGVVQMSHYAAALALLRQRAVIVTYSRKGQIDVQLSGDQKERADPGTPADPIYRSVNGTDVADILAARDAENASVTESVSSESGPSADESKKEKGFFYTRRILDEEELKKEDATRTFENVLFSVEVLGPDGKVLDPAEAAALSLQPRSASADTEEETKDAKSGSSSGRSRSAKDAPIEDPPVSVTYEPNGTCVPYRVIIRSGDPETTDTDLTEGLTVNISRAGKVTIGDEE